MGYERTDSLMMRLDRWLTRHHELNVDTDAGNPQSCLENFVRSLDHDAVERDLLDFMRDMRCFNDDLYISLLDGFVIVYPHCAVHLLMMDTPLFKYTHQQVKDHLID